MSRKEELIRDLVEEMLGHYEQSDLSGHDDIRDKLPELLSRVWDEARKPDTIDAEVLLKDNQIAYVRSHAEAFPTSGTAYLLKERDLLLQLLRDIEDADSFQRGWNARVKYGDWTILGRLSPGSLFETKRGDRGVVTTVRFLATSQVEIILLGDGFREWESWDKIVREIIIQPEV